MKFEEWWKKKLPYINKARIQLNSDYIKVYFENAYEHGRAYAKIASQQSTALDREHPATNEEGNYYECCGGLVTHRIWCNKKGNR